MFKMGTPLTRRKSYRENRQIENSVNETEDDFEVTELLQWLSLKTSLQLFNFPLIGRGVKTPKAIAKGDHLISIPIEKLMTRKSVQTRFPSHYSTHLMLTCFLIQESSKECSKWKTYLKSLPKSYDVPYFDLRENLNHVPKYLKSTFQDQVDLVARNFKHSKICKDVNEFAWAWFTVNTRGVYYEDGHDNLALAPFLDMFNHDHSVQVQSKLINGDYVLIAENETLANTQAFINYGPHDNLKLYLEYGFVLPDNPHDCVPLRLEDLNEAFTDDQKEFIENHDLHGKLQILPNEEIVSWPFLACLAIADLDKDYHRVFYQDLEIDRWSKMKIRLIVENVTNELLQALVQCKNSKILPSLLQIHLNICQNALKQL